MLLAEVIEEFSGFLRFKVSWELDLEDRLKGGHHRDSLEGWGEVDLDNFRVFSSLRVELDLVASEEAVHKPREKVLGHLHHVFEVSVGLVDFDRGEL